jgi:hypothetical protein
MAKHSYVIHITQLFPMAFIMILIALFSDATTWTFGQLDIQVNKPPVISVTSPISGKISQATTIHASISDPDGNITSIIWNQEDEFGPIEMNISQDKRLMSFVPTQNVTYVFSVEAIDNNGSATLEPVQARIGP